MGKSKLVNNDMDTRSQQTQLEKISEKFENVRASFWERLFNKGRR